MVFRSKALKPVIIGLAIANLAVYALFHISYLLNVSAFGDAVNYISRFAELMHNLLMPAVIAVSALVLINKATLKDAFIGMIPLALTRAIFTLPYYYIYFISYGYSTAESIPMSLGVSILAVLFSYGEGALLLWAVRIGAGRLCESHSLDGDMLNTACYISRAILSVILGAVLLVFTAELFDTVSFLIDYHDSFSTGEILYMTGRYLLIVITAAVALPLLHKLKNRLVTSIEENTVEITD